MKRPLEQDYTSLTAYTRALEQFCDALAQPEQPKVRTGNCLRVGVCASEGHKIQPQRTWVGLTEEDLKLLSAKWRIVYGAWMDDFAKDIEAKFKKKNT